MINPLRALFAKATAMFLRVFFTIGEKTPARSGLRDISNF